MARPATAAVRFLTGEREPVRLATTGNITLSGLQTIDGVLTEVGDRVLVKNQTDATENGIRIASEGQWYRAPDARTSRSMQKGTTVAVQMGTANVGGVFSFQTLNPVIGDDDILFERYSPVLTATALAPAIVAATEKTTPVNADTVPLIDSAAANALKWVTWANVKATLKAYFDTLYALAAHTHTFASLTSKPTTISGYGIADANPGQRSGFKATKGGTDQTSIASATVTKVTYPTEDYDVGGYYDAANSRYTPPAGIPIRLYHIFRATGGIVDQAECSARILKNGTFVATAADMASGTSIASSMIVYDDVPNGTDYYEAGCYIAGVGTKTIAGNITYSQFFGGPW